MKPPVMPIDSFNEKYTPEPYSGCWLWTGATTTGGYGKIKTGNFRMDAHRAAYILFRGEIPNDLFVLHRCDTPACVNPDHLFLGTALDNIRDSAIKRRSAVCDRHGMAKLTWDAIEEIRKSNESQRAIGRRYGVSQGQVSLIKSGKSWKSTSEI